MRDLEIVCFMEADFAHGYTVAIRVTSPDCWPQRMLAPAGGRQKTGVDAIGPTLQPDTCSFDFTPQIGKVALQAVPTCIQCARRFEAVAIIRRRAHFRQPCSGRGQWHSAGGKLNSTLPKRLKVDAILEASFELRFDSDASAVPEILFGHLVSTPAWAGFRPARLPTADIPIALRKSEQNLMHAPSIELTSNDGAIKVRFGPYSIAYSRVGKYPGWDPTFRDEISATVSRVFEILPDIEIKRIGLRYVNALRSDMHEIRGYDDIAISVGIGAETISTRLNVNYKIRETDDLEIACRIASAELAQGTIPENATIVVDLDVYTPDAAVPVDAAEIREWVEIAHDVEKRNFFKILGDHATQRLREDA